MIRLERELARNWMFSLGGEDVPEAFEAIDMPHDWAIEAAYDPRMNQGEPQGFLDRWGIGYYRLDLEIAEVEEDHIYLLEFGGIYEDSTVMLNGVAVGGRQYGYSPFRCDITETVRSGSNDLLVRVDNTKSPVDRWYSGAGIYRPVKLIVLPKLHLDPWEVVVKSSVCGHTAQIDIEPAIHATVRADLFDQDLLVATTEGEGSLHLTVEEASLWSAETPKLYRLRLSLLVEGEVQDAYEQKIGFRQVEIDTLQGLRVNGVPIKLNGVCLHQEVGCRGVAAKPEIWRARLEELKELGCNALRLSHHLFADFFLDLADELGFYVYEESFDKWTGGLYGRYFEMDWEADIEVMVKRDRNRPSILIWGVGNEVEHQGQKSMLVILEQLVKKVRSLDDRPVSYAMNPHFKERNEVDLSQIDDIQKFVDEVDEFEIYDNAERVRRIKGIADLVDIISCNYMEQWYELVHEAIPDKPILGSETYQYFRGHLEQMQHFTDEIPADIVSRYDYVIGCMIWTGYDYLGESMGWPAKGWGGALLRTNGERRSSYYILQSYWSKKPMVHFAVLDYSQPDEGVKEHWDMPMYVPHWQFNQFHKTVIPYMIATNCERVVLTLNGKRFYPTLPEDSPSGVIRGYLPWMPGTVEAIGYNGDTEVARHTLVTPDVAAALHFDQEEVLISDAGDIEQLFTVRARDKAGNPCYLETAKVRFALEGDAKLVGVDNGDMMSHESYQGQLVHLYRGAASAQIRLPEASSRAVLTAYAAGMKPARLIIYRSEGSNRA